MSYRDHRSEDAQEYRALYKTARWRKRRAAHLAVEPLCRMCQARGLLNDGSRTMEGKPQTNARRRFLVADHVEPHKGDRYKFFFGKLQTLCPDHHDVVKQGEESRGFSVEVGLDGWPIDINHPANR
ncbi:HNH endonuclease [Stappia sp. F7233]|uniref:HNH endonuclease n=1 Tax=Stappia albiluteola TaxID=2758565 RepID=A0A839AKE7_9HYPH|nr:HNH endonuclease [Stappia albiluteola]MBA5779484.1 HNH endonuclease [Stappia albiluteola]